MALGHEQVLPAVIVVVKKADSPAGLQPGNESNSGIRRLIVEIALSCVAEQHVGFIGKIRDDNVRTAIIVVISEINAHAGEGIAVPIEACSTSQSDFGERSVAVVVKQERPDRVVCDKDIDPAVIVVISESYPECFALFRLDSRLFGYSVKIPLPLLR